MSREDLFSLTGQRIDGKYAVQGVVGEGGYGVVYHAIDIGLDRPVAVKVLKLPAQLPTHAREEMLASFRREAQMLRDLSTETVGVVQCLGVGAVVLADSSWAPYLVLEWMDGESLSAWMRRRRASGVQREDFATVFQLLAGAASGLGTAHRGSSGAKRPPMAHRDVKPENIFVVGGGTRTKVLDFGIAKLMRSESMTAAMSSTGQQPAAFTPLYGAPEQFKKAFGASGTWTDTYAFALVLTELLVGFHPYQADSFEQCMAAALDPNERPVPARFGVSLGSELDSAFSRALAVRAEERFPDVAAFWDALARGLKASTRPPAAVRQAGAPTPPSAPLPPPRLPTKAGPPARTALPVQTFQPGAAGVVSGGAPVAGPQPPVHAAAPLPAETRLAVNTFQPAVAAAHGAVGVPAVADTPEQPPTPLATVSPPSTPNLGVSRRSLTIVGAIAGAVVFLGLALWGATAMFSESSQERRERDSVRAPTASAGVASSAAATEVTVPAGTLAMGTDEADAPADQKPTRQVPVKSFSLDATEVTVEEYATCVSSGQCTAPAVGQYCNGDRPDRNDHPINCVSWAQAKSYCEFRHKRLPTEAEWEWAARGARSTTARFPSGTEVSPQVCWNRSAGTCGTRSGDRSPLTVVGMTGNVREWVDDWYGSYEPGSKLTSRKVVRGGYWSARDPLELRTTARSAFDPAFKGDTIGFRCAR